MREKINYLTKRDYNFIKKDYEKSGLSKHEYAKRLRIAYPTFINVLKTKHAARYTAETLIEDVRNSKKIIAKPITKIKTKSPEDKMWENLRESNTGFAGPKEFATYSKRLQNKLNKCPLKKQYARGILYDFEPDLIGCTELVENWRGDFTKSKKES